jgi:hypothetical protein
VGARAQVAVSGGGFPHRTRGHTVFLGWRGDREMRRAERGAVGGGLVYWEAGFGFLFSELSLCAGQGGAGQARAGHKR